MLKRVVNEQEKLLSLASQSSRADSDDESLESPRGYLFDHKSDLTADNHVKDSEF